MRWHSRLAAARCTLDTTVFTRWLGCHRVCPPQDRNAIERSVAQPAVVERSQAADRVGFAYRSGGLHLRPTPRRPHAPSRRRRRLRSDQWHQTVVDAPDERVAHERRVAAVAMPLLNAAVLPGAVGLHGGLGLTLGYRELLWKLKTKAASQHHHLQTALEHRAAQADAPRSTPRLASLIAVPVRVFKQNVVLAKLHRRWLACKGELRGAASEVRVPCAPIRQGRVCVCVVRVCGCVSFPLTTCPVFVDVAHAIRSSGLTVALRWSVRRPVCERSATHTVHMAADGLA